MYSRARSALASPPHAAAIPQSTASCATRWRVARCDGHPLGNEHPLSKKGGGLSNASIERRPPARQCMLPRAPRRWHVLRGRLGCAGVLEATLPGRGNALQQTARTPSHDHRAATSSRLPMTPDGANNEPEHLAAPPNEPLPHFLLTATHAELRRLSVDKNHKADTAL